MQEKINHTLRLTAEHINAGRDELLRLNALDVKNCDRSDVALFDRLHLDQNKIDGMIDSLRQVEAKPYPVGQTLYAFTHDNGMRVENKTVPFGTILIVYESRPDVTIEATATALKSGNRIVLKGGKEAKNSNLFLHKYWTASLQEAGLSTDRVRYLDMQRTDFQSFLKNPDTPLDLIIPRGGEKLIAYVRSVATCPVLVSGRGNNFMYIAPSADPTMALNLIVESKISKISACNALDKVLFHRDISADFYEKVKAALAENEVEIIENPQEEAVWSEEFLDKKIVLARTESLTAAAKKINKYSGKHTAVIVTADPTEAAKFTKITDCAAVGHNVSTRFTDGFQFGLGAEMAISTDKLHHRGPLGIEHLVTNKWYITGHGQTR